MTEVREEDGENVYVLATGAPAAPTGGWPLYVVREGAIYSLGTAYHRSVIPLLVVPASVRVGMTWETRTADGDLLYSGNVASRDEVQTAFGRRVVWEVQHGQGGPAENYDAGYPYPLREFAGVNPGPLIEGLGPKRGDVVLPLDAQPPPSAAPTLKATPLGDEPMVEVGEEGLLVTHVSATIDPNREGGRPVVRVASLVPSYVNPPGYYALRPAQGCSVFDGAALTDLPSGPGLTPCPDGAAVVVAEQGGTSQLPESTPGLSSGIVVEIPECYDLPGQCPPPMRLNAYSVEGIFRDAAGDARVLGRGDYGLVLGDYVQGSAADFVTYGYDPIANVEPLGRLLETRGLTTQRDLPEPLPFSWLASASDDRLGVGWFRGRDRLFWYQLTRGQITAAHASVPLPMRSVTARPGGRDTLSLSPDGRVDRIEVTVDGVEVRPLGRIALPADAWLAGGFVQGDDLIAVVQRGFVHSIGGIYDPPPQLGAPWLYRVPLPASAAVAPAGSTPRAS